MLVNPKYEGEVEKFCGELFEVLVKHFRENFLGKKRIAKPIFKKILNNKDCLESFLIGYFTAVYNEAKSYEYLEGYLVRGFKGFHNYAFSLESLAEYFDDEVRAYVRPKAKIDLNQLCSNGYSSNTE